MKTRFIAIFLGLFALTFIGVLAFELRPTEASGFACPSHNSMTSSSTQSASASFGVVTVTYTPPLTDQQIEDAALSACSSGYQTNGQGAATLAENEATANAMNACRNVPSFGCNGECLASATSPDCAVIRSTGAVGSQLLSRDDSQGTAQVTCFIQATVTVEGAYSAICSLP